MNGKLTSSSEALVCQRRWEVTWKHSGEPSAALTLRRRALDASRLQKQWAASASASIPASATCPTLSVSERISWAGQKPSARYSHWLTEWSLHGSLLTRIAGCLRSHYHRRSGFCVVFGGLCLIPAAECWVYLIISCHLGSCKSRMSSWMGWGQTWRGVRGSLSDPRSLEAL